MKFIGNQLLGRQSRLKLLKYVKQESVLEIEAGKIDLHLIIRKYIVTT